MKRLWVAAALFPLAMLVIFLADRAGWPKDDDRDYYGIG